MTEGKGNVIAFPGRDTLPAPTIFDHAPDPECVAMAESLLALAKAGQVQGFALAAIGTDLDGLDYAIHTWCGLSTKRPLRALGPVSVLHHRMDAFAHLHTVPARLTQEREAP